MLIEDIIICISEYLDTKEIINMSMTEKNAKEYY